MPNVRAEIDDLRELNPPEELEEEASQLFDDADAAIDEIEQLIEEDPEAFFGPTRIPSPTSTREPPKWDSSSAGTRASVGQSSGSDQSATGPLMPSCGTCVTSALLGASSVEQLDQNLDALDRVDFGADEPAAIDEFAVDRGIDLWEQSRLAADVAVAELAPLEVGVSASRATRRAEGREHRQDHRLPAWLYARKVATASPSPTPNPDAMKFTLDTTLPETARRDERGSRGRCAVRPGRVRRRRSCGSLRRQRLRHGAAPTGL